MVKFRFLDHTADIKFRIYGKNLNEIFEHAVLAVSFYISSGEKVSARKKKVIKVNGASPESLFYNFLDELIYLIDAENFIAATAKVNVKDSNLRAEIYGDEVYRYKLKHAKAATYSEMYIKKKNKGWEAQAVIDV